MGVSTAARCHIGFLSSFSRELGLMVAKSSSSSTRLTNPPMWQLPSSILLTDPSPTHGHTCLLHPHSLSTRLGTWVTHEPPMRQETLCACCCSCSANFGAWRIMMTMCVLPQLAYTASRGFPHSAIPDWASTMWKEGWRKVMFLHQLFPASLARNVSCFECSVLS